MIKLQKKRDKDFTILNISDPQVNSNEYENDNMVGKIFRYTMEKLVEEVKPDLITVSGDIAFAPQPDAYEKFADYMDSLGILWAPVWGNHDNQGGAEEVNRMADGYLKHKFCLFEKGDPALGNGNYIILINEGEKPCEALFMMDSHDRKSYVDENGETKSDWACFEPNQLEWYSEKAEEFKKLGYTDTTLITHIPIYAYNRAFDAAFSGDMRAEEVPPTDNSLSHWNEGYKDSFGVRHERICSFCKDEGAFEVLKKAGTTKHVLVGHDHVNNFGICYDGIWLMYSLKTGIGCYYSKDLIGGTVMKVSSDGISSVEHKFVDIRSFFGENE